MSKDIDIFITDNRMLQFMQYCIDTELQGIATPKQWCEVVGFTYNNLSHVKAGTKSFTVEHIYRAALALDLNMEYVFGFSDEILRGDTKIEPLAMLQQAVRAVENQLRNSNKKSNKSLRRTNIHKK